MHPYRLHSVLIKEIAIRDSICPDRILKPDQGLWHEETPICSCRNLKLERLSIRRLCAHF
jgi:hypothetical protein